MEISFETPRGATVKIKAGKIGGFDAEVNGRPHTGSVAKFVENDPEAGPCVHLAGRQKAQVPADMVKAVRKFFADAIVAQETAKKVYAEEYKSSALGFSATMDARMYNPNSNH